MRCRDPPAPCCRGHLGDGPPGVGLTWGDVAAALPGCQGQHGGFALLRPPQIQLHEAPCDVNVVKGVILEVSVTVPQRPGDTRRMLGTGTLGCCPHRGAGAGPQPTHWRYM